MVRNVSVVAHFRAELALQSVLLARILADLPPRMAPVALAGAHDRAAVGT